MSDLRIHIIQPLPKPEKRPSRLSALIVWMVAALGLLISSLLSLRLYTALDGLNAQAQILIVNLAYYLPFVALPVFLLAKRTPGLYEAYRPNPISLFNVISIVILAIVGVFFVNDITILWSIPFEELGLNLNTSVLPAAGNAQELVLSVITVAVVPAVCEEFLFRGALFSAFEAYGTKHAMWISSLLFMLVHASFLGAPSELILGMVISALVFWSDSIYAGLIYHTVHNTAAVVLEYMQNQWTGGAEAAGSLTILQSIGGIAGVIELLPSIALAVILIALTLKLFRIRGRLRGIVMEKPQRKALSAYEWLALIGGAICCAALYAGDMIIMLMEA